MSDSTPMPFKGRLYTGNFNLNPPNDPLWVKGLKSGNYGQIH